MRNFLFRPNIRRGRVFASLFMAGLFNFAQAQNEPIWEWVKSFGGTDSDKTYSLVVKPGGVYAAGTFYSPSITFGSSTLINQGETDGFLVRYNQHGAPISGISIGNEGLDGIMGVGTDGSGNIYITGYFSAPTLNIGSFTLVNNDPNDTTDVFVAKLDHTGQDVIWAKSAGTTVGDGSYSIAVDETGNVFVTGYMGGSEMFFENYTLTSYGAMDIFTVKYDTDGNEIWAVNAGGEGYDISRSVITDGMGNCYVTGSFSSTTATFGFEEISNLGVNDVF